MTENSIKNHKAVEILNGKVLKTMNDRVILATYFMSASTKIINPENASHFKLVKDHNSIE